MAITILVADDSATMRRITEMTFAGEDAKVVAVESGDAALRRLGEVRPDIVLADASMPNTDGYELARAIRGNPTSASTAVLLLVSQHVPYDAERGRASGVDDHISKPFDTQALIDRVHQVIGRPRAALASSPAPAPAAVPPRVAGAVPPLPPERPAPRPHAPTIGGIGPSIAQAAGAMPVSGTPNATPASAARAPMRSTVAFGAAPPQPPSAAHAAPQPPAQPPAARPGPSMASTPSRSNAAGRPMLELAEEPTAESRVDASMSLDPEAFESSLDNKVTSRPEPMPGMMSFSIPKSMPERLTSLGLTREQVDAVLQLSREVIERVVWEVVPDLAETLIREEIRRLSAE